jgi:di/tricarboxylate transporter
LGFALRHKINPVLMGLLVINGATAGGFSPISIFGGIVNTVVQRNHLPGNPTLLFVSSFVINLLLCVIVFALFGGRELLGRRVQVTDESVEHEEVPGGSGTTSTTAPPQTSTPVTSLDRYRVFTLIGILGLAGGALFFDLNVGFVAFTVAAVLTLLDPQGSKGAVSQIAWPTVLLVCGIITYVSLMQDIGTDKWLGAQVAGIGAPLIAALLICFIGGAVSAFASTTGILGALIPLAVPIILGGRIGAVGVIIALSLSSSIVDSSPFSTSGSLVVANSDEQDRDVVFRKLMIWGMSMVVVIPIFTWVVFIVPGWL